MHKNTIKKAKNEWKTKDEKIEPVTTLIFERNITIFSSINPVIFLGDNRCNWPVTFALLTSQKNAFSWWAFPEHVVSAKGQGRYIPRHQVHAAVFSPNLGIQLFISEFLDGSASGDREHPDWVKWLSTASEHGTSTDISESAAICIDPDSAQFSTDPFASTQAEWYRWDALRLPVDSVQLASLTVHQRDCYVLL